MESAKDELDHELLPFVRVYKDGRVERLSGTDRIPPSIDSQSGVSSKDVVIEAETGVSARLYRPTTISPPHKKLPLVIYFHGGGFLIESAFSPLYHHYLNSLVAEAQVVVVSVEYRLAPEHPLPVAYDDSWAAIQWVGSHIKGEGSEVWLKELVDFERVFLGGDSAGANIAHNMAMKSNCMDEMKFLGVVLVHPYFWSKEIIVAETSLLVMKDVVDAVWSYVCPSSLMGNDDPRVNPVAEGAPSLSGLGCSKVLVFVAEKDLLRDKGWVYYEALNKTEWNGVVKIVETQGEDHVFHLFNPNCHKAVDMITCLASFLNQY